MSGASPPTSPSCRRCGGGNDWHHTALASDGGFQGRSARLKNVFLLGEQMSPTYSRPCLIMFSRSDVCVALPFQMRPGSSRYGIPLGEPMLGYCRDVGLDGLPIDPNHPFNRAG